ncbi:MAG: MltR family transcriptional regulator [Pseudomonadota bacterium]
MRGWFVETMDEMRAVQEMEHDSDRASALVISALVEARLTSALQACLYEDRKIIDDFFRNSGPLGSFSAKTDLALLMGRLSPDAHKDLVTLRKIRNRFAHELGASFEEQSIRDLSANFTLIEKMCVDMESETEPPPGFAFTMRMSDYNSRIKGARARFEMTGQLFVAGLDNRARERGRFDDLDNWM